MIIVHLNVASIKGLMGVSMGWGLLLIKVLLLNNVLGHLKCWSCLVDERRALSGAHFGRVEEAGLGVSV